MLPDNFEIVIKTLPGLETVLRNEVLKLGGRNPKIIKRAVVCDGDLGFVYKANLWLRDAIRILVPISKFQIRDEQNLYNKVKAIAWEEIFPINATFAIDAVVFSDRFRNSHFMALKAKDAIVDRFREKTGKRPSIQKDDPDIRIDLHIQRHHVSISLDSSGESLHKRKYRVSVDQAPLSEVLAAGILDLIEWDGQEALIDPMCGSGTFLTEAALKAANVPPNVFRERFAFKNWLNFDGELFELIHQKSLEKERAQMPTLLGFDISPTVLAKAKRNTKQALMEDFISFEKQDFSKWQPRTDIPRRGTLIMNPPYDEKLEADIPELYTAIGDSLKQNFADYTAWILSGSQEGFKHIALKPSKKIELRNGKMPVWLYRYDLYEGSRKSLDVK